MNKSLLKYIFNVLFSLLVYPVMAQLSPGNLHETHKELEGVSNCTRCHETGQQLSATKCLQCHQLLSQRIENKKGLHSTPKYQYCKTCHIEHQGRDFALIYWKNGQNNFNHEITGYTLEGAHLKLSCRQCHQPDFIYNPKELINAGKDLKRTFFGLQRACLICHEDEHRGQINNECLTCHDMTAWKPVLQFDHSKTRFVLAGKHQVVLCKRCHPVQKSTDQDVGSDYIKFKGIKHDTCADCHRDIHSGKFGSNCSSCHSTKGWHEAANRNFDHNRTRFSLEGLHRKIACSKCHIPGLSIKIPRFDACTDCHKDFHFGQLKSNGKLSNCESCHTVNGFSPSIFDITRHQESRYPLQGAHLAVPCQACHKKSITGVHLQFDSFRCEGCHNDPHDGQVNTYLVQDSHLTGQDRCEYCHSVESWSHIIFNHKATGFELTGKHNEIKCSTCHTKNASGVLQIRDLERTCQSCHKDIHGKQFDNYDDTPLGSCSHCHTPSGWKNLIFEHNTMAKFKLEGKHAKIKCSECHKSENKNSGIVRYKPLEKDCAACHVKRTYPGKE